MCHSVLSLLFIDRESLGLSGLNAESQQQGDQNGDSECVFHHILKYYIAPENILCIYS